MICPVCGGLGYLEELDKEEVVFVDCYYCDGTGVVELQESEEE